MVFRRLLLSLMGERPTCVMVNGRVHMEPIGEPAIGTLFGEEEVEALREVLLSGRTLARGPDVTAFEGDFAAHCGVPHAVSVSSCTAALRIAFQVCRIGAGDEVIVPANAFWNTVVGLVERGAAVKIADLDPRTLQMDPQALERVIGPKTKVVLILSFGGSPCDMERIRAVCDRHGAVLVEDAAHAAGATYRGRKVGSLSDITCFSFQSLKNMSTMGEGGMLTTANPEYAGEAVKLRDCWPIGSRTPRSNTAFGDYQQPAYTQFMRPGDSFEADWTRLDVVGTNLRMSAAQAVVGRVQLRRLDGHNQLRRDMAAAYDATLAALPGLTPVGTYPDCVSNYHLYNFLIGEETGIDRDRFIIALKDDYGITAINRFWPIHIHPVFRMNGHALGEAPVFERIWFRRQVALPIGPGLSRDKVEYITDSVRALYSVLLCASG